MAEAVSLEFLAAQLRLVLDEQRAMRAEQRRIADILAGVLRSVEHIRDDLTLSVKAEIGGLFANLETRLENRIAAEIDSRLPDA